MNKFKFFHDTATGAVELPTVREIRNEAFARLFPGVRGLRRDGYSMLVGKARQGDAWLPVTRCIEYKARPSLHTCNAKCLGGKPTGICECRCGGKNHGRGMFTRLLYPEGS